MGATGTFTISLNFELFWGVRDRLPAFACAGNILGARDAIPRMLDLFDRYGVHGTSATVGLLFFDRKADLMDRCPSCARNMPTRPCRPIRASASSVRTSGRIPIISACR